MSYEGDVKMPCGRKYYCGRTDCRHADICAGLRDGMMYRRGPGAEIEPQKNKKPLAYPADIVYLYDGSLDGFFCCVHESVYQKEIPQAIWHEAEAQPTMFRQKLIETDMDKAKKVARSVPEKIAVRAMEIIQLCFLSYQEQKELAMLRFLLLGYQLGGAVCYMFGHEDVKPVLDMTKHIGGESHLLKGFVRFSDYDGVLAAAISPKNFVLPLLVEHFTLRFPNEDFLIYDKTHRYALIYENKKAEILPMEGIEFPEANETEKEYRALWCRFYKTISIEARENPRCRMTHMPKRYWENMVEMQEYLN